MTNVIKDIKQPLLNRLNYVYFFVYIVYLIIIIDVLFLQGWLSTILPEKPHIFWWYTIIFVLPHIVGSFFSFAEKKYINYYKNIFLFIPILILLIWGVSKLSFEFHVFLLIFFTVRHVFFQQFYLLPIFNYKPNIVYKISVYLAIFIGTLIFFNSLYVLKTDLSINVLKFIYGDLYSTIIIILTGLFVITMGINWKIFLNKKTNLIHIGNLLIVFSFLSFGSSYVFFAILLTRVIHDITAFIFYYMHAQQKVDSKDNGNVIYNILRKFRLPMIISIPLLSIGLANLELAIIISAYLSYLHYYMESFMWKRGSPHRIDMGI